MSRIRVEIIGVPVDVVDWHAALARMSEWAQARQSRYVCLTNVHSVVTASRDAEFHKALRRADLCAPDGAPVAWMLRQLGASGQKRLNGPDLMLRQLSAASSARGKVYLYGSTPETLEKLRARIEQGYPGVSVVGTHSPPFRALTDDEDEADVKRINASGAQIVFVSLGCPKQELWMSAHRGRVHALMVGVGAAFDFHAGLQPRAPRWMRNTGFEWLHRLWCEPRRLWRRYLFTNVTFLVKAGGQWLLTRITRQRPAARPPWPALMSSELPRHRQGSHSRHPG